ncbi:MAG: porin family protein [Sulfurovum sp.]|nr:porin family protein [Sulfurovum sp.]
MKKSILSIVTILGLTTLSSAQSDIERAHAQMESIHVSLDENRFYAGFGVSYLSMLNATTKEEFSTTGQSVHAGYQYGKHIAIEGRYTVNFSAVSYASGTTGGLDLADYPTDFTNIGLYAKVLYPMDNISVYGLMGYGEVKLTNIPIDDVDRAESGFQWGGGISYMIGDSFEVFVDYIFLYSGTGFDFLALQDEQDASMLTLGLSYKF